LHDRLLSLQSTAYVADLDVTGIWSRFAKKHEIFILSDLDYAEVYFDDHPRPRAAVPGAIE